MPRFERTTGDVKQFIHFDYLRWGDGVRVALRSGDAKAFEGYGSPQIFAELLPTTVRSPLPWRGTEDGPHQAVDFFEFDEVPGTYEPDVVADRILTALADQGGEWWETPPEPSPSAAAS